MSKKDAARLFDQAVGASADDRPSPVDPTASEVIAHADSLGFTFTEAELRSHMKELIYYRAKFARGLGLAACPYPRPGAKLIITTRPARFHATFRHLEYVRPASRLH